MTQSVAGAQFIEEGLRMDEHPGILFRDGPSGRRPVVAGGPDVWEIIRTIKDFQEDQPDATEEELVVNVSDHSDNPQRMVRTAIDYWASYPDEIHDWIARVEAIGDRHFAAWQSKQELLAG